MFLRGSNLTYGQKLYTFFSFYDFKGLQMYFVGLHYIKAYKNT